MKKMISLLALFAAVVMLEGCCGCGSSKSKTQSKKSHKVVKKVAKKGMKKVAKKGMKKPQSDFQKLRNEANALIKDL